ncbi:MAG: 3-dehydroquinate synthase, partial [Rhodospirillales bacterium]|nr:3-dehydroquinate synthase [Rhodospirillales bacterium]
MTHLPPLPRPEAESARASADGVILQRFAVAFDYPVYFTRGLLDPGNPILAQALARREPGRRHRFAALVDSGVAAAWPELDVRLARYAAHHADRLELAGEPLTVPGGETCKNDPAQVNRVLALLQRQGIDRQSTLVAIGGGALLDMAGYAASLCHRGVRLVRVPTTVLAQNDSGIGVKTAVNAFGAKNFLGTFAPPFAVVNDLAFLDTLPARDRLAGMAEAVKVAAIRDGEFLDWLDAEAEALAAFDPAAMAYMIRRCAELHMRHIATAGDPFESGSARPLDFGHWAAHKLEMLSAHRLRHGEAVAIGMALDTLYAARTGLL